MKYDFDRVIDRENTNSIKYDRAGRKKPKDVLPLWIADMDFETPPCVIDALVRHSKHGIFGYSDTGEAYFQVLQSWFSRRFDWHIEPDWLIKTPGIVTAIHIAIRALTRKGDAIIIQQPVYYPFASAVQLTGRRLVVNELLYDEGYYRIDFDDFEKKIRQNNVRLFILCNPHNPVGRVFTREELMRLGDICLRHGVLVIADEIHQDFIYKGHRHCVFESLHPAYRDIAITCTAPSKTFNLAGLQLSNIFIPNPRLRGAFISEYAQSGLSQSPVMGIVACRAAYEGGEEWLYELLQYLSGNMALIGAFLQERMPHIKLVGPEGTYLAWLDFTALRLGAKELDERITNRAGLWLNNGATFGAGGAGFMRLNAACPRQVLQEALERLQRAVT